MKPGTGTTGIFILGLLVAAVLQLGAEERIALTFGTFTENEVNNDPYASGNLFLVPGLTVHLASLDIPLYAKIQFENRMKPSVLAGDTYSGTELRHRYHFGGTLELIPGFKFQPEYEARVKSYAGSSFSEKGIWENRFHMNFVFPLGQAWNLVFKAMPTYVLEKSAADYRGGGTSTYSDFFSEGSLGTAWTIDDRNVLSLLLYEESKLSQQFVSGPGTINSGEVFQMLELQLRLIWNHQFRNGISISPFARVGILRNEYSRTAGVTTAANRRRDRFGMTLRSRSDVGTIGSFLECYYQRQEQDGGTPNHRFVFKLGIEYGIIR